MGNRPLFGGLPTLTWKLPVVEAAWVALIPEGAPPVVGGTTIFELMSYRRLAGTRLSIIFPGQLFLVWWRRCLLNER